jgi:ion channel POLLUX/CASTOR
MAYSLKERLYYTIDNSLSKGTANIILWLLIILVLVIIAMASLVWFTGVSPEETLIDQIKNFTKIVTKYHLSNEAPIFNLATFILFITGLFVSGALIGTLTTGLSNKLAKIREGHSKVIETGHTVILGWSSHVFSIISELVIANENQSRSCVVVLGGNPKPDMITAINKNVGQTGRTRIVCRQGDRWAQTDLRQLSLDTTKCIIINQHSHVPSDVARTLLAIINRPDRRQELLHIVAVVETQQEAELCRIIGKNEVEIIQTGDFLARLEAQTCLQTGLPYVYQEILNYAGDEIYFKEEPKLVDRSYGDVLNAYRNSAVIGVCSKSGEVALNPPINSPINEGDKIIAISEDDDTIILDKPDNLEIKEGAIENDYASIKSSESFLILGWNENTSRMLTNLNEYVVVGSTVKVISNNSITEEKILSLRSNLSNIILEFEYKNFSDKKILEEIEYQEFRHVVIQGNDKLKIQEADTITLSTLVYLRDIRERSGKDFSIITELFDSTNHDLIQTSEADDFIISDNIISSAITQLSENKLLSKVFNELFRPEGSEIYLKPAQNYVKLDNNINFYTVLESALRKNETAIGYRLYRFSKLKSHLVGGKEMTYGVILNPDKTQSIEFSKDDSVIVLSES